MTLDSPTWAATTESPPAPNPTPPPRRRIPEGRSVVAAAVLSAVLASGTTFALVEYALPQSPTPSSTATQASSASLTRGSVTTTPGDASAVAAKALPSVVTITTESAAVGRFGNAGTATGVGSGIILTSGGYILTNNHVVENSTSLSVQLADGRTVSATVVKTDPQHDLAVIKANATGLTPATLGDS